MKILSCWKIPMATASVSCRSQARIERSSGQTRPLTMPRRQKSVHNGEPMGAAGVSLGETSGIEGEVCHTLRFAGRPICRYLLVGDGLSNQRPLPCEGSVIVC